MFARHGWRAGLGMLTLAGALLLGACSTARLEPPAPVVDRGDSALAAGRGGQGAGAATSGLNGGLAGQGTNGSGGANGVTTVDLSGSQSALATEVARVVYFDFDSFVVKDEYRPLLETTVRQFNASRQRRLLIEGHTDERGGREYNLALGQKRADAVVRTLLLLGLQESQMEAVSYGEERPAVEGSGETAWVKNRRAELKDR